MLLMSWGSDILLEAERNSVRRWLTRFTIRRAAAVACDCRAVRDKIIELAAYPAENIVTFPWGVDLERFRPAPARVKLRDKLGWHNNKVVIYTRSLEPVYGIDVFLEAMKTVIGTVPDTRVFILGDGSLENEVKTFITRHNLGHAIHLAGRAPHETLPDYFNEADLYVSSSYSDGSSVSLLEAMACRLPVVVTDLPSNREWVTPGVNGWLVPAGDAGALSSAVLEALQQEDKARAMAGNNLALAREKADWNKNFAVLLGAYERLHKGA
jgi:glycosyltransferase involved in cell wall biosynthesis